MLEVRLKPISFCCKPVGNFEPPPVYFMKKQHNLLATAKHRSPLKKWSKRFMTPGALEGMEHEKQHQARHGGDQREAQPSRDFPNTDIFQDRLHRGH